MDGLILPAPASTSTSSDGVGLRVIDYGRWSMSANADASGNGFDLTLKADTRGYGRLLDRIVVTSAYNGSHPIGVYTDNGTDPRNLLDLTTQSAGDVADENNPPYVLPGSDVVVRFWVPVTFRPLCVASIQYRLVERV